MLYYDWIDVSEGIDVNKTSSSKKCIMWHYWYFLDKGFKFPMAAAIGDVLMMSMNLNSIAILSIHGVVYHCIISGTSTSKST